MALSHACGLLSVLRPRAFPSRVMLVSVTPLIEFPPAPPLAMSHSSKSTLLLKKKTKNNGGKQEVITATKKYLTPFQHQINL